MSNCLYIGINRNNKHVVLLNSDFHLAQYLATIKGELPGVLPPNEYLQVCAAPLLISRVQNKVNKICLIMLAVLHRPKFLLAIFKQ